jgi:hypothetical protein
MPLPGTAVDDTDHLRLSGTAGTYLHLVGSAATSRRVRRVTRPGRSRAASRALYGDKGGREPSRRLEGSAAAWRRRWARCGAPGRVLPRGPQAGGVTPSGYSISWSNSWNAVAAASIAPTTISDTRRWARCTRKAKPPSRSRYRRIVPATCSAAAWICAHSLFARRCCRPCPDQQPHLALRHIIPNPVSGQRENIGRLMNSAHARRRTTSQQRSILRDTGGGTLLAQDSKALSWTVPTVWRRPVNESAGQRSR